MPPCPVVYTHENNLANYNGNVVNVAIARSVADISANLFTVNT